MKLLLRNILTALFFITLYYGVEVLIGSYSIDALPIIQMVNQFMIVLAIFFAIDLLIKCYHNQRNKKTDH